METSIPNFTKAIASTAALPKNGSAKKSPNLEEMAQQVAEEAAQVEAKRLQIVALQREAEGKKQAEKTEAMNTAFANAQKYEEWARAEGPKNREEASYLLQISRESMEEYQRLKAELGLANSEEISEEEKPSFWAFHHGKAWVFSLLLAACSIWGLYHYVMEYKVEIDVKNAAIADPSLKIGNPYDESSMQGILYDNLIQFTDIPKLWLFLLIIAPFLFFYCLPIVKTKVNPWRDFNETDGRTRLWLFFAFFAVTFICSVLYHLAGSSR